jgi:hypothetical protein
MKSGVDARLSKAETATGATETEPVILLCGLYGREVPPECEAATIAKARAAQPGAVVLWVDLLVRDAHGEAVCAHCGELHRAPGVPDTLTLLQRAEAMP